MTSDLAATLDRAAAFLRALPESLRGPDTVVAREQPAIAVFDSDMKLEFYNSAYEQLTGMSGAWLDIKPKLGEIIDKMRELLF